MNPQASQNFIRTNFMLLLIFILIFAGNSISSFPQRIRGFYRGEVFVNFLVNRYLVGKNLTTLDVLAALFLKADLRHFGARCDS